MKNRPRCCALSGAALLALAGMVRADDAVQPEKAAAPAWKRLAIPTHVGSGYFYVQSPEGRDSAAMRDTEHEAALAGAVAAGPVAGYELTSRVVVRADDDKSLGLVVGALTANSAKVVPAGASDRPLRGFWLVECASIAQAAAVAESLRMDPGVREAYVDVRTPTALRSDLPTDPGFASQWSLHNTTVPTNDANLEPVWKAGYTGAGVTVGIVESGWYTLHEDLAANYNSDASQASAVWGSHGTSVAGIVAMVANNGVGGAGAAYGAQVSKLYIGSQATNAAAFGFRNDLNFVKNNSWGPVDNGVARKLASVELAAFEDAVENGRGGLGTIFVWAGGNGGTGADRVDYDPYASNRRTIAVGAIDSLDRRSVYSEPGASLLVVAQSDYSFSSSSDPGIYSAMAAAGYTDNFGGTSASSPLASGVVAVLLQANPQLTWRDVQHVLVRSARKNRPSDASWRFNGAGLHVSDQFGFGAVDAGAAVELALEWPGVAPEASSTTGVIEEALGIPDNDVTGLTRTAAVPSSLRIESVELVLDATHNACGQLRVRLVSPTGTESLLANTRTDNANTYEGGYVFTTVQHFGEQAAGTWTLHVADTAAGTTGTLNSWEVRLYGTDAPCPCDWDGDLDRDVPDIFAFLSSWFAGTGDFDLSGTNEVPDIFAFLSCWFAGPCP